MPASKIADFTAPATSNTTFRLSEHRGHPVVLYFYPKDNTSGCTMEGEQFRDLHAKFRKLGAVVVGVSRDSRKSHEGFKAKMGFPFELISDADELPTALPATLIMAANGGASWKSGPLAAPNAAETYQPRSAQLAPKKGSDKSRAVPFRMASSCLPRYALASLAACCAPAARCSGCNCT